MPKLILLAALATVAMTQLIGSRKEFGRAHGLRFEYDDRHNLVLALNDTNCFLIDAPEDPWDAIIHDTEAATQACEQIYQQLQSGTGVTSWSQVQAREEYHSALEGLQCLRHQIYHVDYTPGE